MPRRNPFECPAKNVGNVRTNWETPDTVEQWRQFGRTKADHPFTPDEASQLEAATNLYKEQNGGHSPPTYSDRSSWDLPLSQRIPPEVQSAIDEKNAEIDNYREVWNRNRAIQRQRIMRWHQAMHELKFARRKVRDLTRELDTIEGELEEFDDSYTGLEEMVQENVEWIKNTQDAFNG